MSSAVRQQRLKEKRLESGRKLANVWLPVADMEALKQVFPGPRGGIDWQAVATAALAGRRPPPPPLPTNVVEEPLCYWRPDRTTPLEIRCQGTNRDRSRCRSKGKFITKLQMPDGRMAEFVTCAQHEEFFKPHPSVLASVKF